jgi:glycerol kinase
MLLNLKTLDWSDSLINAFGLTRDCLPQIRANAIRIGDTVEDTFGFRLPITGLCVDQQAALFGHRCLQVGETKATYGTGCFLLSNIGKSSGSRAMGLLTCVGWNIDGNLSYVLDGGVYSAGSLVQWLVELGLVGDVRELSHLAADVDDTNGVVMIPAFSGLAAPHWKGQARACWAGMSLGTDRRHLVRAALESIAYRVKDIVSSMKVADITIHRLHADGGLTRCEFLMQFQADVLGIPVVCANMPERTAFGVGLMAGIGCKLWNGLAELPHPNMDIKTYKPRAEVKGRCSQLYEKWRSICLEVATWE